MKLGGKVAVITGGGSGMGRATALLFAKEGAKVVIGEWNETTMNETLEMIKKAGGEAIGVKTNVANQADAEALVDKAIAKYGRLDILDNTAGVMDAMAGVGEVDNAMFERVMGINATGPFYLMRKAVQHFQKNGGGVIVNVASYAGQHGGAAGFAYTASKHAIIGMTRNTAWRYALEGIRCNAIAAGGVNTNIMASVDMSKMDPKGAERAGKGASMIPMMGEAQDIANVALFLASDDSRYINGAVINADGGWISA